MSRWALYILVQMRGPWGMAEWWRDSEKKPTNTSTYVSRFSEVVIISGLNEVRLGTENVPATDVDSSFSRCKRACRETFGKNNENL